MTDDDNDLFRHTFAAMTTHCELQLYGVSAADGLAIALQIEARVAELVRRYNFHATDSWLTQAVNHRRGHRVPLDAESLAILTTVRQHAERTEGLFDISVGTYAARLRLARSMAEAAKIRQQLQRYTGLARWSLVADCLVFDNYYTRLDLGGVIKEYAVDESARIAQAAGVVAGLVNYGGDLTTWGVKPNQQRFVAAIPHPLEPQKMLFGLDLHNQALTTSGHYARQRALKDGVLSHVIPSTPIAQGWLSASVVSTSALVSGIYSTALLLNDNINLPNECFAVVVDATGRIHTLHP
jgi:thiamine biosynthesis lipoprotein